jgi:hypothetical protein
MAFSPEFTNTMKEAVAPGPQRLLAGVALAAAGAGGKGTLITALHGRWQLTHIRYKCQRT